MFRTSCWTNGMSKAEVQSQGGKTNRQTQQGYIKNEPRTLSASRELFRLIQKEGRSPSLPFFLGPLCGADGRNKYLSSALLRRHTSQHSTAQHSTLCSALVVFAFAGMLGGLRLLLEAGFVRLARWRNPWSCRRHSRHFVRSKTWCS